MSKAWLLSDPRLDRFSIAAELRAAHSNGRLDLHYQPLVDSDDLSLVAYESLIHWSHPVRGLIAPCRFIPIAEQNGLIHDLGEWVLRRACRDVALLGSRYVGVNVSAVQLQRTDLAATFARIFEEEAVEPVQITIEVTETVPLRDGTELRNLQALRDLGCYLAIDDFGTGHASFDYLDRFPFNVLKIDKSFIAQLGRSSADETFVELLCKLGHRRNIVVVAEGVETEEQLRLLRDMGCSRVQGYLLGRPAPVGVWAAKDRAPR